MTEAVPQELTTEAVTETVPQKLTTEATRESVPPELTTEAATLNAVVTEQTTAETERAETEPGLSTHASIPETAAPTKEAEVVQTQATAAARTESNSDVFIYEDAVGEESV